MGEGNPEMGEGKTDRDRNEDQKMERERWEGGRGKRGVTEGEI